MTVVLYLDPMTGHVPGSDGAARPLTKLGLELHGRQVLEHVGVTVIPCKGSTLDLNLVFLLIN